MSDKKEALETLIRRGAALKDQISAMKNELDACNEAIFSYAEFDGTCKTSHLVGAGFKVIVQKNERFKYDQKKIEEAAEWFAPEVFDKAFVPVHIRKPDAVAIKKLALENEDFNNAVNYAREVEYGKPTIKYEPLEVD